MSDYAQLLHSIGRNVYKQHKFEEVLGKICSYNGTL